MWYAGVAENVAIPAHNAQSETKNKLQGQELRTALATRAVSTSATDLAKDTEVTASYGVRTSRSSSPPRFFFHNTISTTSDNSLCCS